MNFNFFPEPHQRHFLWVGKFRRTLQSNQRAGANKRKSRPTAKRIRSVRCPYSETPSPVGLQFFDHTRTIALLFFHSLLRLSSVSSFRLQPVGHCRHTSNADGFRLRTAAARRSGRVGRQFFANVPFVFRRRAVTARPLPDQVLKLLCHAHFQRRYRRPDPLADNKNCNTRKAVKVSCLYSFFIFTVSHCGSCQAGLQKNPPQTPEITL